MKQALEMALEALEAALSDDKPYIENSKQAITAIKQVLAQPEQEPVAEYVGFTDYAQTKDDAHGFGKVKRLKFIPLNARLYTTAPQRKPLTDEQIDGIASKFYPRSYGLDEFARAIEAAHGIKE